MAREDLVAQLLRQLMQKEGPPEESDNSILQKMIIPQDKATLSDSFSVQKVSSTWGNFSWGGSQWG